MHRAEQRAFDEFVANHPIGTTLRGRVTDVRAFGAFCELTEGVEGLLEIIDFEGASRPMTFPDDYPRVGDSLDVTVAFINHEARKIRLTQHWFGVT